MIPALPEGLPTGFDRLIMRCSVDLTEAQLEGLRRASQFEGNAVHATFRQNVQIADAACGFRGTIGVHDNRNLRVLEEGETGIGLHYSYDLERDVKHKDAKADNWDRLSKAVSDVLGTQEMLVTMISLFDEKQIIPGTALPIPLGESGVSGFSEIRGVRLVQPDPADKNNELYSVVLDKHATSEDLLRRGLQRANDVATLAYKESRKSS